MVIRIGTSGWSYDHRHPELYPPGLTARDRLACYASSFGTAELNSSFYRWPRPAAFGEPARDLYAALGFRGEDVRLTKAVGPHVASRDRESLPAV